MIACRSWSWTRLFLSIVFLSFFLSPSIPLIWVHIFAFNLIGFMKGFPVDPSAVFFGHHHLLGARSPLAFYFSMLRLSDWMSRPPCYVQKAISSAEREEEKEENKTHSPSTPILFVPPWFGFFFFGGGRRDRESRGRTAILLLPVFACEMCCFINKLRLYNTVCQPPFSLAFFPLSLHIFTSVHPTDTPPPHHLIQVPLTNTTEEQWWLQSRKRERTVRWVGTAESNLLPSFLSLACMHIPVVVTLSGLWSV